MDSDNSFSTSNNGINDFNILIFNSEWESQIQYIIDKMNEHIEVDHFIEKYEEVHNRKFEFDYIRYMYSYLKHIMIDQALYIYDTLTEDHKCIIVEVIEQHYPHLNELIDVHKTIKLMSMDTESIITS